MRRPNSDYIYRVIFFWGGLLLLMIGGGVACTSQPIVVPSALVLNAATDLNPDAQNRPLSVVIRVYAFKDKNAFERLSLQDIASGKSDSELFESAVLSRQEHVLLPGNNASIDVSPQEGAQYVAVVAFYRQPDLNRWRLLFSKNLMAAHESLRLDRCGLSSQSGALVSLPGQNLSIPAECAGANTATMKPPALGLPVNEFKYDVPTRRVPLSKKIGAGS